MSTDIVMFVTKRDGRTEEVKFDKITERINKLVDKNEKKFIDPILIGQKVVAYLHTGITTEILDIESANICINLCTRHPLYANLGGRILISNLHKKTSNLFSHKVQNIQRDIGFFDEKYYKFVAKNAVELDQMIDYSRDYMFDYFGFKTLERAYLIKNIENGTIYERPQDMFLRISSFLNQDNLDQTRETYDLLSKGFYTHASPTLFNGASKRSQLSSCFLIGTDDSIEGITNTWKCVSQISKYGGGIGLHVSNIRSKGSIIKGTNGPSSGIIPMLQVYNSIARYINQGGKRKGSIAVYLEPHHADIFEFLDLRKNFGDENKRARDLFLALWISDLFMKQVKDDSDWYLMCPDECRGLNDTWGKEYEELYWKYVSEGKFREKIKARKLMKAIWISQQETGTPYVTFKDTVNRKSNQKNLGTIRSSNLCNEIVEYSDANEHAVCNLASIAINKMVVPFDYTGKKWIIYTKENCKYCRWTKAWLDEYDLEEIKIEDSSISQDKLIAMQKLANDMEKNGQLTDETLTYPQIFCKMDDEVKYIGGFEDLFKFTRSTYDYEKLRHVAYVATRNLNKVIDLNYYPTIETKRSNLKNRPVGLGIQGMAYAISQLRIEFESEECIEFNKKFMESIYLGAMQCSVDISKERSEKMSDLIKRLQETKTLSIVPEFYDPNFTWVLERNTHGNKLMEDSYEYESKVINDLYHELKPQQLELQKNHEKTTTGSYSTYEGSPLSKGLFQFNLWGIDNDETNFPSQWSKVKRDLEKYGARNSLLTALMPTASTSQILGNNECFELFTSNIYTRNTLAGDFPIVNKHLVNDLIKIKEWDNETKDMIIADNGSVKNIKKIPEIIRNLYKTQWEVKQIWVLKTAKARGPFVDQTQSMNVFYEQPDDKKLNSCLFWGWENGLKTGIYYLRSKPASNATKFTIDPRIVEKIKEEECENCSA